MLNEELWGLSPEAEARNAELMLRGVIAHHEIDGRLVVTAPSQEIAESAVADVLGDHFGVDWLGPTNHRIIPARVLNYEHIPLNTVYLTVEARADERVDGAYVAEDDERVVVSVFKCSPRFGDRGPDEPGLTRVLLNGHLAGRPVIDALTGEVLPAVETPLD